MPGYICGIDVDTTNIKGALYSLNGDEVARQPVSYESHISRERFHEQEPDDWVQGVIEVLGHIMSRTPGKPLKAISLSTQGGTMVPVDRHYEPLTRAMTWLDRRGEEVLKEHKHLTGR